MGRALGVAGLCAVVGAVGARAARAHNGETGAGSPGSVPSPLAPPFVPPTLGGGPTTPGTPGGGGGGRGGETTPSWERWWRANADAIVPPRGRRERVATKEEPGAPETLGPGRTLSSAIRPEILPTLLWAADPKQGFESRVVSACYLAIGKAASRPEDLRPLFEAARRRDAAEEEIEAALLGLGLLRRTVAGTGPGDTTLDLARTALLNALDDGKPMARARGLAALALGLLGDQPTNAPVPAPPEGSGVSRALWGKARESFAGDEIPPALLMGLSFQPPSTIPPDVLEGLKRIGTQGRLATTSYGPVARSHALLALARLDERGSFGVPMGILLGRKHGVVERRAAAVALGIAAPRLDDAQRREAISRLVDAAHASGTGPEFLPAALAAVSRLLAASLASGSDALLVESRDDPREPGRTRTREGDGPALLFEGLHAAVYGVKPQAILALATAANRREAALAFPRFREFRAKAIDALRKLADEREGTPENRGAYYVGLGLLEDVESLPTLADAAARSALDAPRACACEALGLLGRPTHPALAPLRAAIEEKGASAGLLERAARALGRLGDPQAAEVLSARLAEGGSDSKRTPIVLALGWTASPAAIAPLVRLVRDRSTSDALRAVACQSLGMLADLEPVPTLSRLAPGAAELPWTEALSVVYSLL
jgi:HEAT repeat protein